MRISVLRSANRRLARFWLRRAGKAWRPFSSAAIPTRWCAIFRIVSQRQSDRCRWGLRSPRGARRRPCGSAWPRARFAARCSWHGFSAACLASAAGNPSRPNGQLCGNRPPDRLAQSNARRRWSMRRQQSGRRDPVPPGGAERRRAFRLRLGVERKRVLLDREATHGR